MQRGNLLGLPVNFIAFAIVTTVVTSGSFKVYGKFITDPVDVVARLNSVVVLILGSASPSTTCTNWTAPTPTSPALSPFAWPIGVVIGGVVYFFLMQGQQIVGVTPAEQEQEEARVAL